MFSFDMLKFADLPIAKFLRSGSQKTIEIDAVQYEQLLLRAKELKSQYDKLKAMSGEGNAVKVSTSQTSNARTDLIIGMAKDLDSKNLAVFGKSLRKVCKAKVVLFVNEPVPDRHTEVARSCDIEIVSYNPTDLGFSIDISGFHPSTSRWPLINKYLEEHGSSYSRIWMLDVRDTYFQSDPFEFVSTEGPNFHVFNGVVRVFKRFSLAMRHFFLSQKLFSIFRNRFLF